ncbi:MAG TPA: DUF1778 domain-containing protein [candidate division Zixibacteria bacterium]|nr:DUF1778 domain-containing protein [candidate division Zixibacteria bacterium]MDD4917589.1 DUF1778 domain-containing protein [candidate division Zixibacteria bacterium]MDM7971512.1 DUF1778 domain-containing protein [candidate division Zixibacteria bacterium]HOD67275.1 DUF1778 domain-containing protein [candidate division Zixibacteria bacterium]HOZ07517.1 DUF1778 domain-containing protein [candidate division Zixibacteria bacterium]
MTKTTVFFIRIDPKDKRIIERAAKIDRRTASDFVRLAALDRAEELIASKKQRASGKKGI